MQSSPEIGGFPLPDPVDPGDYLCCTIKVPNEPHHIQAFLGVMYDLTQWINWQRDAAHIGVRAARVWKPIWQDISFSLCNVSGVGIGADEGVELMIRQDPDNPCLLQSSIDGTTWCTFADISKCMTGAGQPGGGQPQPPPGGGTQCYTVNFNANSRGLIPTIVNAGDTLSIQSASGAGSDNGLNWYCDDGSVYFAGFCNGQSHLDGGDPAPTIPHMSLVIEINGVYYAANAGATITVPGGVVNQPVYIQTNDPTIAANSGSYQVSVCVTNNQASTWCRKIDLTINSGGFVAGTANTPTGHGEQWVVGTGWRGNIYTNANPNDSSDCLIKLNFASAVVINTINFTGLFDPANDVPYPPFIARNGTISTTGPDTTPVDLTDTNAGSVTQITLYLAAAIAAGGLVVNPLILTCQLSGIGTVPPELIHWQTC